MRRALAGALLSAVDGRAAASQTPISRLNQLWKPVTYKTTYLLLLSQTTELTAGRVGSAAWQRCFSSDPRDGPRVGDLPRSRSVQQERLAEGSDFESAEATGRPAAWPARSPDAPPDPATRRGGRDTMPDERTAEEAAWMTIRHGSGKSAEAILAGPEAAEAHHSNTGVKFVYQQQPSPDVRDTDVGTTTPGAAEQVARHYAEVAGSANESSRGGPTDDMPELGGVAGVFSPQGEMGSDYGLRSPRPAGSRRRGQPPDSEGSGGGRGGGGPEATPGGGGGGGEGHDTRWRGWPGELAGNGISETIKAGVERLQDTYQQMFRNGPRGVDNDRSGTGRHSTSHPSPRGDGWNSP